MVAQLLSKWSGTDRDIANKENKLWNVKRSQLAPTIFAHEGWRETLTCGSVYDKKAVDRVFIIVVHRFLKHVNNWRTEHDDVIMGYITRKMERLPDLQRYMTRREQLTGATEEYWKRWSYCEGTSQNDILMNVDEPML